MLASIRDGFFRTGWLFPAMAPPAFLLGRAPGNIVLGVFFIWALLALRPADMQAPARVLVLWLLVLAAFIAGILVAIDPGRVVNYWLKFAVFSSVFFIVLSVLHGAEHKPARLITFMGQCAIVTSVIMLCQFAYHMYMGGFSPANQIFPGWLSYVFPFGLFYLWENPQIKWHKAMIAMFTLLVVLMLFFSDSRTELLGATAGGIVIWFIISRRFIISLLTLVILIPLVILLQNPLNYFSSQPGNTEGNTEVLTFDKSHIDALSSHRLQIWNNAITHPPANPVIGIGMGHVRYTEVVKLRQGGAVKHLHNIFIDAWYETGWLGLVTLVAWLGYLFWHAAHGLLRADVTERIRAAPWMGSAVAVLVAAMLDRGYLSKDVTFYLVFCLGVLWHLSQQRNLPERGTDR